MTGLRSGGSDASSIMKLLDKIQEYSVKGLIIMGLAMYPMLFILWLLHELG
jgi:hypothetical protein